MAEQKTYVPRCSARATTFRDGGSVLRISFDADALIEFVKNHTNAKGRINLGVSKRREEGKYGETHTVWLNTWEPKPKQDAPPQAEEPTIGGFIQRQPAAPALALPREPDDDVPF
jgi:hypothetical protein